MANNQDFYIESAVQRANQLEAAEAAALADIAAHKANGDKISAAQSLQELANIHTERANLNGLYQQYVQSQQPPQEPELTQEERAAKPWNRMTYADAYELAKNSKYGIDDNGFRAGIAEVQRRRARGE
jgi:hypothetical protein